MLAFIPSLRQQTQRHLCPLKHQKHFVSQCLFMLKVFEESVHFTNCFSTFSCVPPSLVSVTPRTRLSDELFCCLHLFWSYSSILLSKAAPGSAARVNLPPNTLWLEPVFHRILSSYIAIIHPVIDRDLALSPSRACVYVWEIERACVCACVF